MLSNSPFVTDTVPAEMTTSESLTAGAAGTTGTGAAAAGGAAGLAAGLAAGFAAGFSCAVATDAQSASAIRVMVVFFTNSPCGLLINWRPNEGGVDRIPSSDQ